MRVLFLTGTPAGYMAPPRLADEQLNAGPDWPDERDGSGRCHSFRTPVGEYSVADILAKVPGEQRPDVLVCLVDASRRNLPRNLGCFRGPKILLLADTHHMRSPLTTMMRYAASEPFDRIVFLYDRHHAPLFDAAGFKNLFWFPGLTFPHGDAKVGAACHAARKKRIAFVGQAGDFHPRRARMLKTLASSGLPFLQTRVGQDQALKIYAESEIGFNCSLNGDLNLRFFEIIAAGGFLLTDELGEGSGLPELRDQGCVFATYRNSSELLEVAADLSKKPGDLRKKAEAGQRWFQSVMGERRRQEMFLRLAMDGTQPEPFHLDVTGARRITFPDRRELAVQTLVYETVQELHRVEEEVVVASQDAPGPFAALAATLPRIRLKQHPVEGPNVLISKSGSPDAIPEPGVKLLWLADGADRASSSLLRGLGEAGFAPISAEAGLFRWVQTPDERLKVAENEVRANRMAVAAGLCVSVISREPGNAVARAFAARLGLAGGEAAAISAARKALAEGRTKEAALALTEFLKVERKDVSAWRLLAQALRGLGRHQEAAGALLSVLRLGPATEEDWRERADCLQALNREAEALHDLLLGALRHPGSRELTGRIVETAARLGLAATARAYRARLEKSGDVSVKTTALVAGGGAAPADPEPVDLFITHNEINRKHGSGVLLERYFRDRGRIVNLRSCTQFGGKADLETIQLFLDASCLRDGGEEEAMLRELLSNFKVGRILCVPFYEADARRALYAKELTGAPLCTYVMDDQTVHAKGIPASLARRLFEASALRLVISPEMRDAYHRSFSLNFDVMPPLLTTREGRRQNRWTGQPAGALIRAALVGNVWSAGQFAQLRAFVRSAGLQLDWFGNAACAWLPRDPDEYAKDGIMARGFLPERELAAKLAEYPFVVIPGGKLDGSEDNEWLTRLSIPSRMVFILGQAATPMLVVGHPETAAARFVTRLGIGAVVSPDGAKAREEIENLLSPNVRGGMIARIAECADRFVFPEAGEWIWRSLKAGVGQPAPFLESCVAHPAMATDEQTQTPVRAASVRPHTLNLQAIDVCNSRCVMCNVWKDGSREMMSLEELKVYLRQPFFSEVRHVGITGGEPTLRKDLVDLYALLPDCLPSLTGASFISHGMQTARAVDIYSRVNTLFRARGLQFSGMISLDGVGEIHDRVRGRKGAFATATATLLALKEAGVQVIAACTIVRSNVYGLHDLLEWGRSHGVYVRFRVAEFIQRLYNGSCATEIRAFSDRELRHLVCFVHVLLNEYERDETIRRTYQSVLSLLTGGRRLIGCPYQKGGAVNINSRGELASCAPKGDSFAPGADEAALHSSLERERARITRDHCASCIHDYHDGWNVETEKQRADARDAAKALYGKPDDAFTTREFAAEAFDPGALRRVLLIGWYGTETAGDIAILRGIIAEYLAVNPALKFTVLSLYPAYTATTVQAWPVELRAKVEVVDFTSRAAATSADDHDAVVMAGGPLMDIPDTAKILALFKLFADHGKPRVIEGCGVGPLNQAAFRWNVCRIARLATRIAVRDIASRDLLRFYGIRKVIEVRADPAETFLRSLALKHEGSDRGVIRCFLRELTSEYPQALTPAQATDRLVALLQQLLGWYPDHRIELWAMHHFPVGKDDRLYARELVRRVASPRLSVQWEPSTPEEIAHAMATAAFCVCMRFHSCVFAANVGVPFLAVDYTAGGKIRAFLEDNGDQNRLCALDELHALTKETFETRVWGRTITAAGKGPIRCNEGPRVLHVISSLTGGGAARALLSLARHSARLGGAGHAVVSLQPADEKGRELAKAAGLEVIEHPGAGRLHRAVTDADIVLVHWWNCPELSSFFRRELPPMRLAVWVHVGGHHSPYLLTPELVRFADSAIACSPHTFEHAAFDPFRDKADSPKAAMILAGAEFERVEGVTPRAHAGFRVGYIGTLDPTKMHPDFVAMSCAVRIPDVQFVVCGGGGVGWLASAAKRLGRAGSFEFTGPVEDIRGILETIDVYGYPLCEDTYAAAELNLQEVMYAGIPVVAFPHGGIRSLIRHGETGILVNSAEEYARAIEGLHRDPRERARLGANAAAYARAHFGAERTGREFNAHFGRLMALPKRARQWGAGGEGKTAGDPPPVLAMNPGGRMFIESIGPQARFFLDTLRNLETRELMAADQRLAGLSQLTFYTYAIHYRKLFPQDALLNFWAGLGFLARGGMPEAMDAFLRASRGGFPHWRPLWYRAHAAERAGQPGEAIAALQTLVRVAPDYPPAVEAMERLRKQSPDLEVLKHPQEHVRNAQAMLGAGKHADARRELECAVRQRPQNIELLELLADLDVRLGRHESAERIVESILAIDPGRNSTVVRTVRKRALRPGKRTLEPAHA